MKKVVLSLVAVAFVASFALTSCKGGNSDANADSNAAPAIEEPAPAPVEDTAVADSAVADSAATVK